MITAYQNGAELLHDNSEFLGTNPYLSVFFFLDAPLLVRTDCSNYALKCETEAGEVLLALKVVPYNLLLFGNPLCIPELAEYLFHRNLALEGVLCSESVGNAFSRHLAERYGIRYEEALAMDFMEAAEITEPSCPEVVPAVPDDLDEICSCLQRFIVDCGLLDTVNREKTLETIGSFRLIREDGIIVSMAKSTPGSERDRRISAVYTRDAYRGKGYARKVVNTLKNEILLSGKIATLNVDKKNPVSNHLYRSLGFERVFSQGEYRKEKEDA